MRKFVVIWIALALAQCSTAPTVEQVNAQRAKMESDCKAKGYAPGTQDFQTCLNLAVANQQQSALQTAGLTGLGLGVAAGLPLLLSDARAKRDIQQIATLDDGIHLYRFRYRSSDQVYVGVIAQDVARVVPRAVVKGSDGLLRVNYDMLGLKLVTWEDWVGR